MRFFWANLPHKPLQLYEHAVIGDVASQSYLYLHTDFRDIYDQTILTDKICKVLLIDIKANVVAVAKFVHTG